MCGFPPIWNAPSGAIPRGELGPQPVVIWCLFLLTVLNVPADVVMLKLTVYSPEAIAAPLIRPVHALGIVTVRVVLVPAATLAGE